MAIVVFSDTFEGSSPTGWSATSSTITTDTTHVLAGSKAMKVVTAHVLANEGAFCDRFVVDPSSVYLVEVYVYGDGIGTVRILWQDFDTYPSGGSSIGTQGFFTPVQTEVGFTKFAFKVRTPAAGIAALVSFSTNVSQALTFWVDSVTVTKINEGMSERAPTRIVVNQPGTATVQTATRPTPPSSFSLPGGLTSVSTSSDLLSKLGSSTVQNIVLEDGVYTKGTAGAQTVGAAHQVYARNLGGAELQFGLVGGQFSNTNGFRVQGLNFNVSDSTKCFSSGAGGIMVAWASGSNHWQILDTDFHGTDDITNAVSVQGSACYEGFTLQRCRAYNFHRNGFRIDSGDVSYVPTTIPVIEDIYTENCVFKTYAQNSNGTAESGLWLGCKATLNRLWCHQVKDYSVDGGRATQKAWQGLWMGVNARDMTVNDLLVTGFIGYGVYLYGSANTDDVSTITFNRLETHYPVNVGFHIEWNNPSARSHDPNVQNVVTQDSYIESQAVGWDADNGTVHSTVKNTIFVGQLDSCVNNYSPGTGMLYDTTGNDYSGKTASAVNIGTSHAPDLPHWGHDLGGYGE